MLRRTKTTNGITVHIMAIVAMVCCGVLSGLNHAWLGMGLCFFLVVYLAEGCAVLPIKQKIKVRFMKLGQLITGKSIPDRLAGEFVPFPILICMIISFTVMYILSKLAYDRGYWLALCILVAALLISNAVFSSYIIWLKIKAYTGYLEKVVSNNKENTAHTEPNKL